MRLYILLVFISNFLLFSKAFSEDSVLLHQQSEWKLSPEVTLSFPQPLKVGFEFAATPHARWRSFGEAGIFSVPFHSRIRNIQMFSVQGGIRYFPKKDGLFSIIGFGFRQASLSTNTSAFKIDDEVLATDGRMSLRTLFVHLGIGITFDLTEKLIVGMDAGYQLALLGGASLSFSNSQTQQDSSSSGLLAVRSDSLGRVARLGVPQVTLMRLSYLLD